jgi:hypothetical protein
VLKAEGELLLPRLPNALHQLVVLEVVDLRGLH